MPPYLEHHPIGIPITSVLLYFALSSNPRIKHRRYIVLDKLPKWRATNDPYDARNYLENTSATISEFLLYFLLVLYFIIFVANYAYVTAQEEAVRQISSLKDKTGNYVTLYSSPLFPDGKDVRQIICGPSHCAFWLGSETLVLRHESIERMVMHNPTVEKKLRDKAAQRPSP